MPIFGDAAFGEVAFGEDLEGSASAPEAVVKLYEKAPVMIIGQNLFRADYGTDFDGAPIDVVLERTGIAIEGMNRDGTFRTNPTSTKLLREITPVIKGTRGTTINIYAGFQSNSVEDEVVWEGPFEYILGETVSVEPLVEGVYLAIKYTSNGQPPWKLLGEELDIAVTGEPYDG